MVLNRTTAKFDIVRRRVKNRNRYNLDIQLMYTSFITGSPGHYHCTLYS
jgi:hypothetical protein